MKKAKTNRERMRSFLLQGLLAGLVCFCVLGILGWGYEGLSLSGMNRRLPAVFHSCLPGCSPFRLRSPRIKSDACYAFSRSLLLPLTRARCRTLTTAHEEKRMMNISWTFSSQDFEIKPSTD